MPARPTRPAPPALVLFDGDCALCRGLVAFARRRDRRRALEFRPLQSAEAQALLAALTPADTGPDSLRVVEGGRVSARAEAVLRLARRLPAPWPWLAAVLRLVPAALRDRCYRAVARRRARWGRGAP